MAKIDNVEAEEAKILTPEEALAKAKEKKDKESEEIRKKLNDKAFLRFLEKNPDAVENSSDDEYLKEKIVVFEKVQKVKQEVKKFIVGESSAEYSAIVDDSFFDTVETIAVDNPAEFLDFSGKVSKYLESVEKSKSLEVAYQSAAKGLGIEVDYNKLSGEEKIRFVNDIHDRMNMLGETAEEELAKAKGNRSFKTYVPFSKTRENWVTQVDTLTSAIDKFKTGEEKLDRDSMLGTLKDMEDIKSGLKGNQAFEIIREEFKKKAQQRVALAIASKNDSALNRDLGTFEKLKTNQSILEEGEFDDMEESISKYSKETLAKGTAGVVESKEAVTLNVFEKGIDSMRKKGLALGLTAEECNEQIIPVLREKIEELEKNRQEGQNTIKLILAKRVLNNLE
jgi:hypothetical protein